MAEFVFKDMVEKAGLADDFVIASAATSREEIGNPVHHGTRNKLAPLGISTAGKMAVQITKDDYNFYDYILTMDESNRRNVKRIIGEDTEQKVFGLLDFSENPRDIADPWYTGNFDITYDDVLEGCQTFLEYLSEKGEV
jgi:protein-tyrosine phosphatase